VTNAPDLFLGLVTHSSSVFNRDNRAGKLIQRLAEALTGHGLRVEFLISDRNDYSAVQFPTTRDSLLKAAVIQSSLERDWRNFVDKAAGTNRSKKAQSYGLYVAMRAKRTLAALRGENSRAAKAYQRLINIDLSHLRVLSEGLDSGAAAIVILEDDASMRSEDLVEEFARILIMARQKNIEFINLSESISAPELGIEAILSRGRGIDSGHRISVIELDTPITNTVCANYYSRAFAEKFCEYIAPPNLTPVRPIDWRLNEMMLANPNTRTWWVQPGLFIQGSMHS
jgi:hypothetical protein